jgi:hypothetical protein
MLLKGDFNPILTLMCTDFLHLPSCQILLDLNFRDKVSKLKLFSNFIKIRLVGVKIFSAGK